MRIRTAILICLIYCIISILTSACQSNKVYDKEASTNGEPENIKSVYCENHLRLISSDKLPVIEIDFNEDAIKIISSIENTLDTNICDRVVYFGLPYDIYQKKVVSTDQSIPLQVCVRKLCSDYHYNSPQRITILMNFGGKLLIEGKIGNTDSLEKWIPYYYFDDDFPMIDNAKTAFILFHWDYRLKSDSLNKVFSSVVKGYLVAANLYSKRLYKKEICELNFEQIDSIKKEMPFNFELSLGKYYKPPQKPRILVTPAWLRKVHSPELKNSYEEYQLDKDSLNQLISRYVASSAALYKESDEIQIDTIIPEIKLKDNKMN